MSNAESGTIDIKPTKSAEAPRGDGSSSAENQKAGRARELGQRLKGWLTGKKENAGVVLKTLSEKGSNINPIRAEARARRAAKKEVNSVAKEVNDDGTILKKSEIKDYSNWRKATRARLGRSLSKDANEYYKSHQSDVDTAYDIAVAARRSNNPDYNPSPKDVIRIRAEAIQQVRSTEQSNRAWTGAEKKRDIREIQSSRGYEQAVADKLKAETGDRTLSRREVARLRRDVLREEYRKGHPSIETQRAKASAQEAADKQAENDKRSAEQKKQQELEDKRREGIAKPRIKALLEPKIAELTKAKGGTALTTEEFNNAADSIIQQYNDELKAKAMAEGGPYAKAIIEVRSDPANATLSDQEVHDKALASAMETIEDEQEASDAATENPRKKQKKNKEGKAAETAAPTGTASESENATAENGNGAETDAPKPATEVTPESILKMFNLDPETDQGKNALKVISEALNTLGTENEQSTDIKGTVLRTVLAVMLALVGVGVFTVAQTSEVAAKQEDYAKAA